jgi:hypothetical protein
MVSTFTRVVPAHWVAEIALQDYIPRIRAVLRKAQSDAEEQIIRGSQGEATMPRPTRRELLRDLI